MWGYYIEPVIFLKFNILKYSIALSSINHHFELERKFIMTPPYSAGTKLGVFILQTVFLGSL